MNAKFDWQEFERLQGMTMARYVIGCAERGDLPSDCVSYVKANADRLDGQHLEISSAQQQMRTSSAQQSAQQGHISTLHI